LPIQCHCILQEAIMSRTLSLIAFVALFASTSVLAQPPGHHSSRYGAAQAHRPANVHRAPPNVAAYHAYTPRRTSRSPRHVSVNISTGYFTPTYYVTPYYAQPAPVVYTVVQAPLPVTASNTTVIMTPEAADNGNEVNSAVARVLGTIIGGVIGHQMGGGHGKTAATIGGAVIGSIIADQISR
jgi:uncharacterized protein YcfJ